jgi:high-affinity nickel-transport protein
MVRIIGPVLRSVDRPWKMYPVGVLFGFGENRSLARSSGAHERVGFDTASSIALLAISAIAQRGTNGESISHGRIVILPVRIPFFRRQYLS